MSTIACSPVVEPIPGVLDDAVIIKMDKKWKGGLIVSPVILSAEIEKTHYCTLLTYGDSLALCNVHLQDLPYADFATKELDVLKYSPYVWLNDEYAIIHWRWRYFFSMASPLIYALNNTIFSAVPDVNGRPIANQKFYFLETDYRELTNLRQQWSLSLGQEIPQLELRHISWKALDEYRGVLDKDHPGVYENMFYIGYSTFQMSSNEVDNYEHKCDSLEAIYVATLKKMISNNDLDKR